MAGPTCIPPKPWGSALASGAVALTAPVKALGSTVGRVLVKAAAAQPTGKLGKNLCGFGDLPPAEAEPEPTLRAFSVRLWNENEELDDAFTVTVTGPNGLSEAFYWDGGPLNDTTFGPYSGEAGAYHIVGVVSEDHGNGNYFIVEITAADPSETLSYTYISTAGFEFDFTLPPSP